MINVLRKKLEKVIKEKAGKEREKSYDEFFSLLRELKQKMNMNEIKTLKERIVFTLN